MSSDVRGGEKARGGRREKRDVAAAGMSNARE